MLLFRGSSRMVRLREFEPYYFSDSLEKSISPPFDSISKSLESELKSFPFNITHLTLPDKDSNGTALIGKWIDLGVLKKREEAVMILISQRSLINGMIRERFGVISLVDIYPEDGLLQPHEKTFPGKVSDRVEVLKDTNAQLEPIFLVVNNKQFDQKLNFLSSKLKPWLEFADTDSVKYKIFNIPVDESHAISEILKTDVAIVADGHHRLAATMQMAKSSTKNDKVFWSSIMAYTTNIDSDSLLIDGIHRALKCRIDNEKLNNLRSVCSSVKADSEVPKDENILILSHDGNMILDQEKIKKRGISAISDIHLIQNIVLKEILGLSNEELDDMIYYTHDIKECKRLVDSGESSIVFVMPPWDKEKLFNLIVKIGFLPQKSTYFFPKVCSGIVMNINR